MPGTEPIYLDNSCTTFPKPKAVTDAVYEYMTTVGSNINRGCYTSSYTTEEVVYETRELLCKMFGGSDARNVIFTRGITESLNILIKGLLKKGDHVIVSPYEHNAVMRPLNTLAESGGITYDRIPCDDKGVLIIDKLSKMIRDNTKAMIITHASNVSGLIMPIGEIGKICRKAGIILIVDSAQTAGVLPIDMKVMNIDALAFTGHKGLMGPQGIGGIIMTDDVADLTLPFIEGGTGSMSDKEITPNVMPDKFEAGTLNIPGIMGLNAALKWVDDIGIDTIGRRESELCGRLIDGIRDLEDSGKICIARIQNQEYTGAVSINCLTMDNSGMAAALDEKYGIMTRVGLHCSPASHKTIGTFPEGTVRFSPGYFNTTEEIDRTIKAIHEIIGGVN